MKRIQFILKKREVYSDGYCTLLESGLHNSAKFVCDKLAKLGYQSDMVDVVDNNDIDREVTRFKPDVVIIEALWVVPEKFDVLSKLHPNVQWIIRLHSRVPFLSAEGQAMGWIKDYQSKKNVVVAANATDIFEDLQQLYPTTKFLYLPNYYPLSAKAPKTKKLNLKSTGLFNVGCFGAIRPLKNQLNQAVAAIKFAQQLHRALDFHINVSRVESNGDPILKNIRSLFVPNSPYKLIEHGWLSHDDFLKLVTTMDVGLQVSYSESFNIVAADFVEMGVPIVTSDQVDWNTPCMVADPNSTADIVNKLLAIGSFMNKLCMWDNGTAFQGLQEYNTQSVSAWKALLV